MTATETYRYLDAHGFTRISERKSRVWAETHDVYITELNYAKTENQDSYWEISLTHHTDRKNKTIQLVVKGEFKLRHPCSKFSIVSKKPGLFKSIFKRKLEWNDFYHVHSAENKDLPKNHATLYELRDCDLSVDADKTIRFSILVETDCSSKLQKLFFFLKELTAQTKG